MTKEVKTDTFAVLSPLPVFPVAAMAYVPFQTDKSMYPEETALSKGTLFTELDKPFKRGALK